MVLLSGSVILSRQIASGRIETANAASAAEDEILKKIDGAGTALNRAQANAKDIRLSFSVAEVDSLLAKVNADLAKGTSLIDEAGRLTTVASAKNAYASIKTNLTQIGQAVSEMALAQKAELESFDRRTGITVRWDGALDDAKAALLDLNSRQGENAVSDLALLDRKLQQINLSAWRFIATEDSKQLPIIEMNAKAGRATLDSVAQTAGTDPLIATTIKSVRDFFEEYLKYVQEGVAQVQLKRKILEDRMGPISLQVNDLLQQASTTASNQSKAADAASLAAQQNGMMQILLFSVISIVAAIVSTLYSVFGIARPIRQISAAMDEVSGGDLSAHIPYATRNDELGDQARALTVFRDGLAEAERLREERTIEEREAAETRKIEMHSLADRFESAVGAVVNMVASAATELQNAASTLTSTAEETTAQATAVAAAANQATANVQTVAAAIEELSASAREIGARLSHSTEVADRAVSEVDQTNGQMTELRGSADQIGTIISLIDNIAGQTNLLALNATIESARAGEAGRGFAVVAQEVKGLAGQTAKATADISERISGIQDSTGDVLGAITGIARTIGEISEGTTAIAAAVEEQNATTAEVARNIQQAAAGTSEVTENIVGVERAAQASSTAAMQVLTSATELSQQAEALRAEVQTFLLSVRAA
ncbi:methyl-accepting chemotaxis protein [Azorhizobium doebereinerae]|uniref:methyl-accepting chemotaxis protein n=1 Tax=Azorhizobium doebereinerae TaxID=281091 RepID=UPI0006863063|nr:HAMP domain-containing methyl-accepting chemotaxis protein [Azorhizobium doebereinerae]